MNMKQKVAESRYNLREKAGEPVWND